MSSIVFHTPLTQEEQSVYGQYFHDLDPEALGIVTGEAVKPLFGQSGLNPQKLSQIWCLCDTDNQGFLNLPQFSAALRMIGHLQANLSAPVASELYQTPAPRLPTFGMRQASVSSNSTGNSTSIPSISSHDVAKFSQLFDRSTNGAPTLPGNKAKEIFLKAKLPTQTLGSIWSLCDRNNSGYLDRTEFIAAMYLIQLTLTNNISVIPPPTSLPNYFWDSINATPLPLSANSTGISVSSPVARKPSISRISSNTFKNAASDWILTYEKKQQFDAIFDSLDKLKAGSLNSQVLVPFFLTSRLSQETLATVWDLADIHNNAEFTKVEFAIAMFLIQKKNNGVDLPDVVPDQLLQSPALGLYSNSDNNDNSNSNRTPSQPQNLQLQPTIPPRDTKPMFNEQTTGGGSLNELLSLNASFTPPNQTIPQPQMTQDNTTNQNSSPSSVPVPLTTSATGFRKFKPASTFGQKIIKEEEEQHPEQQVSAPFQQKSVVAPAATEPVFTPEITPVQVPPATTTTTTTTTQSQGQIPASVNKTAYTSILPSVPNFASAPMPQRSVQNNDLFADSTASAQLSQATTELANLSNQVSSLTKQATEVNDKKVRAQQELERVTQLKTSIESKLATLRASYDQEVQQTEKVESLLLRSRKDTETLQQELSVAEANYHAVEGKLTELQKELQDSEQSNSQLKEQIGNLNAMAASLQTELNEKQQKVKQERSMVDVNSKQLELNQITVDNLKAEIQGLGEQLAVFFDKRKELDDYSANIEKQHSELQNRHGEFVSKSHDLEAKKLELDQREQDVQQRTKQIEEQEQIYHQQIAKLQEMFDDLNNQRESFTKADEDLQRQQIEYAQKVQELSEKQLKLAMGEVPIEATRADNKSRNLASSTQDPISRFVEETVNNSSLAVHDEEGKQESDVFDKDIPTTPSQTEVDDENDEHPQDDETAAQVLADRFDGDLNEYGIPRTQSLTSSVANNAPQSVRDEVEDETQQQLDHGDAETLEKGTHGKSEAVDVNIEKTIPGGWSGPTEEGDETMVRSEDTKEETSEGKLRSTVEDESEDESIQQSPVMAAQEPGITNTKKSINDEFPPIQELNIDESDSSENDDHFEDSKDVIFSTPATDPQQKPASNFVSLKAPTIPENDAFGDEFAGLEQAAPEEEDDNLDNSDSMEGFEKIEHKDLDDELQQGGFTGTMTTLENADADAPHSPPAAKEGTPVGNDEWDEIFAGFGNSKTNAAPSIQQPAPSKPAQTLSSPVPINRPIATTPKSLAVEELSSMGFTQEEATKALEQCNWDLEAATNYLLDSA